MDLEPRVGGERQGRPNVHGTDHIANVVQGGYRRGDQKPYSNRNLLIDPLLTTDETDRVVRGKLHDENDKSTPCPVPSTLHPSATTHPSYVL